GAQRAAEDGLIDVAEADALFGEGAQRLLVVPGGVADFDHSRVFAKALQEGREVGAVFLGVLERNGKLDEQSAEFIFGGDGVEAGLGERFVFGIGLDGGGGSGFDDRDRRVGEGAVELGGEEEFRIHFGGAGPLAAKAGLDVSVERCVDLDQVEVLREKSDGMLAALQSLWVDGPFPVLVGPASGTDADWLGRRHHKSKSKAARQGHEGRTRGTKETTSEEYRDDAEAAVAAGRGLERAGAEGDGVPDGEDDGGLAGGEAGDEQLRRDVGSARHFVEAVEGDDARGAAFGGGAGALKRAQDGLLGL